MSSASSQPPYKRRTGYCRNDPGLLRRYIVRSAPFHQILFVYIQHVERHNPDSIDHFNNFIVIYLSKARRCLFCP